MRLRIKKYLWDVSQACQAIEQFIEGKTFEDYENDLQLRSAVERQFLIIGEALSQAFRESIEVEHGITDVHEIIGFRNMLVHGYSIIKNERVWDISKNVMPILLQEVTDLLGEETEYDN